MSVPLYKFPCLKKLCGQFNVHAKVKNGERTVQRMLKEHCREHWGEAASKELRTYIVPTIRKMVFSDYTKYRILRLRRQRNCASGISRLLQNEGISASRRGIPKFLLKYKQSGTIARQKTCAWSSSLHDMQDLLFIVFCRDIL